MTLTDTENKELEYIRVQKQVMESERELLTLQTLRDKLVKEFITFRIKELEEKKKVVKK